MEDLELPTTTASVVTEAGDYPHHSTPTTDPAGEDSYYIDSNCSTPYVSAPSSPGRAFDGGGRSGKYFYSAPASPMHSVLSTASLRSSGLASEASSGSGSFEFEFSARFAASYNDLAEEEVGTMSSADELFLNGQIRPLKLSTHLQRPDGNGDCGDEIGEAGEKDFDRNGGSVLQRSRDLRLSGKSVRRRTRSLSPLRDTTSFDWSDLVAKGQDGLSQRNYGKGGGDEIASNETTPSASASSSRCSSAGRSSKRWVFLKDFLRSKSEGRSNHKLWTNISFSPAKDKKPETLKPPKKSPAKGLGKRRVPVSAHELHYMANRAQAEEMRKKTYLPYRQGLLGCLGFSSKSYGAMNGLARALNPVSSR